MKANTPTLRSFSDVSSANHPTQLNLAVLEDLIRRPGPNAHRRLKEQIRFAPMEILPLAQFCLTHKRETLAQAIIESGIEILRDLDLNGKAPVANCALYRTELWLQRMLLETTGQVININAPGFATWALDNREVIGNRAKNLQKCFWGCTNAFQREIHNDPARSIKLAAILTALECTQAKRGATGVVCDVWKQLENFDNKVLSSEDLSLLKQTMHLHTENHRVRAIDEYRKSSLARWLFSPFYDAEKYALKKPNEAMKKVL